MVDWLYNQQRDPIRVMAMNSAVIRTGFRRPPEQRFPLSSPPRPVDRSDRSTPERTP